tara:strand:+ start:9556 stop:11631 length:2076 start_codon:yes stop_codon:yes gene_type:complete
MILFTLLCLLACTEREEFERPSTPRANLDDSPSEIEVPDIIIEDEEENIFSDIDTSTPNDPLLKYMWHIDNQGRNDFAVTPQIAGNDINLGNAQQFSEIIGNINNVVVSDGRIDLDHPDLKGSTDYRNSINFILSQTVIGSDPTSTSNSNHGTFVMGLIGAKKDNEIGIYGIAPKANLIGYNYVESSQSTYKELLNRISAPKDTIYNYSFGTNQCTFSYEWSISSLVTSINANLNDYIYVISSGNDYWGYASLCGGSGFFLGNSNYSQENTIHESIVVGAMSARGTMTTYSSPGSNLTFTAPGGEDIAINGNPIMSLDIAGCGEGSATVDSALDFEKGEDADNEDCDYSYSMGTGTSFAAPIVSGIFSLVKSACTGCSYRDVKHHIINTVRVINPGEVNLSHLLGDDLTNYVYDRGWITNAAGYKFSNRYGFGLPDAEAAVIEAIEKVEEGSFLPPVIYTHNEVLHEYYSSYPAANIPDFDVNGVTDTIEVDAHNFKVETVRVKVDISHFYPSDLGIEITSPSGTISQLMHINSNIVEFDIDNKYFLSNAFYGEDVKGEWTIKVLDAEAIIDGTLNSWSISFTGHQDPNNSDLVEPNEVEGVEYVSAGDFIWEANTDSDLLRYEVCINQSSADDCLAPHWSTTQALTINLTSISGEYGLYALEAGETYNFHIRAIDLNENQSEITTLGFTY